MKKIKLILVFAGFGFLLSLICGLCAGASAGRLFGMAFLWLAVFAAIGVGVSTLFDSLLASEEPSDMGSEDSPAPAATKTSGQVVDITVDDDVLEDSGHDNAYLVGSSHQMLTSEDLGVQGAPASNKPAMAAKASAETEGIQDLPGVGMGMSAAPAGNPMAAAMVKENQSAASPKADNGGFVPVKNLETMYNVSGTESQTPKQADAQASEKSGGFTAQSGLDVLPDMSELNFGGSSGSSEFSDSINNQSDFATGGARNKKTDTSSFGNEELIAKAISSVLARDDS